MPLPPGANIADAAALADELARFRVVDANRLTGLLAEFTGNRAADLADYLTRRGALTLFQAERALAGSARILVLGPYRLIGGPERGTFGPVFTAVHASKPGQFSICVLPLRNLWRARQAKQLARALSGAVTHPTVAPLLDVDSANGHHYLVWAATATERLSDRVKTSGPLAPGEVAALLGHLANALTACHASGTAHGALTPRAVAISQDGLPRLLELGAGTLLAQTIADDEALFDSISAATASADVLTYAAPELAADPIAPTPASDQYALGAVGYFAVTGLPPYPHPTLADQLRAKRTGPPPSAAIVSQDVSTELATVFERMMAPDPGARFATLNDVAVRLGELATAVPAPPADPPDVESLLLSKLRAIRHRSGAVTWAGSPSGQLPKRDDSDASVNFELPESAPETLPDARVRVPDAANVETPRVRPTPHPAPTAHTPDPTGDTAHRREAINPDATGLPADPRLSAPAPVLWHTAAGTEEPSGAPPSAPPPRSVVWKKMKRNLLFWQTVSDTIQTSVFGPPAVTPGQTTRLTVFLHTPSATDSVRTLSRAFQHDAELIGTGYLTREVQRASEIAVHLSVANAGVVKTLLRCQWRGQPHRLGFDLHVPWESPEGPSPGLVSVGLRGVRIGQIEFQFNVLPRKA